MKRKRDEALGNKVSRTQKRPYKRRNKFASEYQKARRSGTEKKFLDTAQSLSTTSAGGIVGTNLTLIPQGTTDVTRIGNKVLVKNINIHLGITLDDQTTVAFMDGYVKYTVYLDRQTNGAAAAYTDIYESATFSSFRNLDNVDRFEILKEAWLHIPCNAASTTHTVEANLKWNWHKKCEIPVHFSATTGVITELRSNSIGVCWISAGSIENIASTARIRFIDS